MGTGEEVLHEFSIVIDATVRKTVSRGTYIFLLNMV